MLDSILDKLGFKGKQVSAFNALLEITGCVKNWQHSFENSLVALDYLVKITQENWIRKVGTERWEQEDSGSMIAKRECFLGLFNQLGLLAKKEPKFTNYDYILLPGALQQGVEKRLDYLTFLLENGIRFSQLVLLGGERPLMKDKEAIAEILKPDATELDMMQALLKNRQLNWPIELSEIKILSINSPKVAGKRPTTLDTIKDWLTRCPSAVNLLAISNQPYISYQNAVIASVLPLGFILDTVGYAVAPDEKISVILDSLARRIYADYSRVKTELAQDIGNEASKQEKSLQIRDNRLVI